MNPLRAVTRPLVIGHRGAAAVAPENTMPAFHTAWTAGAGWVEADVAPTADGVLVMLHDDEVDRTTDGTGPLRALTGRAVSALDAGSWFGPAFAGVGVPTLSELLDDLRTAHGTEDRRLLLEIKGAHTAANIRDIVEAIRAAQVQDRVFLESFELDALRMVRELLPVEPFGLLVERIEGDPVSACRELGATAYNPHYLDLLGRPEVIEPLHDADIAVMVWTADDPADWARLTDLGVDAIITNNPGGLVSWQRGG